MLANDFLLIFQNRFWQQIFELTKVFFQTTKILYVKIVMLMYILHMKMKINK